MRNVLVVAMGANALLACSLLVDTSGLSGGARGGSGNDAGGDAATDGRGESGTNDGGETSGPTVTALAAGGDHVCMVYAGAARQSSACT